MNSYSLFIGLSLVCFSFFQLWVLAVILTVLMDIRRHLDAGKGRESHD